GTLIFPPGTTEQVIQVKVMEATEGGEAEDEFFVVLGDAVNAVIQDERGEGSIFEDDLASCPTITVGPSTLPNAKADVSYTQRFSGAGGGQIETFSLSGGSLPPGLALNQTTGVVSGVPVAAGGFSFELTVADTTGCLGTRQFTLTVDPAAPKISSFSPTSGRAGTSVVIVGARLTGATQVRFADKPATTVTVNSSGQITAIVPPGATTGPILVTGPGGSTVSTVAFTILNSAPTATDGTLSAKQNTPTTGKLTASDPEGTPLRFETVRSESTFRGIVTITNVTTGEYTYTPGRDFVGTESFFFRVFDGVAYSNLGRVTVTVAPDTSPRISSVEVSGKDLVVNGENFGQGATVLVNGVAKAATNDAQNPTRKLVAKKAGKKIKVGQTVTVQVRNPDGTTSAVFNFTRQ
ncbi:MAG TPA: putative Ig domain-containing protein, partial [Acidobacteriota bacterium]|nr:putative Ig domain-containing protein [Acidobacteriota bacterium]